MSTLLLVAKVLSGISLLVVALAAWDIRRRKSFPGLSYGGIALSPGRLRTAYLPHLTSVSWGRSTLGGWWWVPPPIRRNREPGPGPRR